MGHMNAQVLLVPFRARRARGGAARSRAAAYPGPRTVLRGKDFSALPVCGAVRPVTAQRAMVERRNSGKPS